MIDSDEFDTMLRNAEDTVFANRWPSSFLAHILDTQDGCLHFEPTGTTLVGEVPSLVQLRRMSQTMIKYESVAEDLGRTVPWTVAMVVGYEAPFRRTTRILTAVDVWGRAHGVVRLSGSQPVKAQVNMTSDPVFSLARMLRTQVPYLYEKGDPAALDKVIEDAQPDDDLPGGKKWSAPC